MEKRFEFKVDMTGFGETAEDAWENAVESFVQDPGSAPEPTYSEPVDGSDELRMDVARMKTDRAALEVIRDYPANGNSEPDVMAAAIEAMQAIAAAQLEGEDWSDLLKEADDDV